MISKEGMVPAGSFRGYGFEFAETYEALAVRAQKFLEAHRWVRGVRKVYFDRGFEQVCVFYCELQPSDVGPSDVWVIVGDIPPAYIDTDTWKNGAEALIGYVSAAEEVLEAVKHGRATESLMPILSSETFEALDPKEVKLMLESRLDFICNRFLPQFPEELRAAGYEV